MVQSPEDDRDFFVIEGGEKVKKIGLLFCLVLAFTTLIAALGCGGNGGEPSESPSQVAEKYMQASIAGDANTAYNLLSSQDRQQITLEQMQQQAEAMKELLAQYSFRVGEETINGDEATVAITITGPDPETGETAEETQSLPLVKEDGAWKINLSSYQTMQ
jgi:hypothetical protein